MTLKLHSLLIDLPNGNLFICSHNTCHCKLTDFDIGILVYKADFESIKHFSNCRYMRYTIIVSRGKLTEIMQVC